jgi:hypothetical protein
MTPIGKTHPLLRALMGVCLALLCAMHGCTGIGASGSLRAVSLGARSLHVELPGTFTHASYVDDPLAGPSFMLSDVSPDDLIKQNITDGLIMHIELLWKPKAGYTPIDSDATNASIRFVVISHGEMGLYAGAGFALPDGDLTEDTVEIAIKDASLQLIESTPGFNDLLSPAQLTGTFTATKNDKMTRQMNMAASQIVTNKLGRTRYVMLDRAFGLPG